MKRYPDEGNNVKAGENIDTKGKRKQHSLSHPYTAHPRLLSSGVDWFVCPLAIPEVSANVEENKRAWGPATHYFLFFLYSYLLPVTSIQRPGN